VAPRPRLARGPPQGLTQRRRAPVTSYPAEGSSSQPHFSIERASAGTALSCQRGRILVLLGPWCVPLPQGSRLECAVLPGCGQPIASATVSFGDYETTAMIGEGGMGRVYKAVQRKLNRAVCIKTLLPQFASDLAISKRFEREATTIGLAGAPEHRLGLRRGHLGGGRALHRDGVRRRPHAAGDPPRRVAGALAAGGEDHRPGAGGALRGAHPQHHPPRPQARQRDGVALQDGSELCKVLDFGIAKSMDDNQEEKLTGAGMVLGTPGYMAPEQLSGEPYDHRIDLYARGDALRRCSPASASSRRPTTPS